MYSSWFARDISPFLIFPYWLKPGILFYFHTAHFFANIIYSHYLMLQTMRVDPGILRNQTQYVFIGTAIGFVAGAINYLTWYRVPITPFLNPLVSLYVAFITYAILRHRLMDISVVIRKSLVYSITIAVASGILFMGVYLLGLQLTEGLSHYSSAVTVVVLIVIGMLFNPLRKGVERLLDQFFGRARYEAAASARTISELISQSASIHTMIPDVSQHIAQIVGAKCGFTELLGESRMEKRGVQRGK